MTFTEVLLVIGVVCIIVGGIMLAFSPFGKEANYTIYDSQYGIYWADSYKVNGNCCSFIQNNKLITVCGNYTIRTR